MAVTHCEVRRYSTNLFVLGNAQTDTGGAVGVGALANEVANRNHVADALVELFETLVNLAERRLVDGSPYLPLTVPVACHRVCRLSHLDHPPRRRQGQGLEFVPALQSVPRRAKKAKAFTGGFLSKLGRPSLSRRRFTPGGEG